MDRAFNSFITRYLAFTIVVFTGILTGGATADAANTAATSAIVFSVRNPSVINFRAELSAQYAATITRIIRNEKGFAIGDRKNPSSYEVSGSITRTAGKSDREVTKYITEENDFDVFTVSIVVTNASTGRIDSKYADSFSGPKGFNRSAEKIARRIIERYRSVAAKESETVTQDADAVPGGVRYAATEVYPYAACGFGAYRDYNRGVFGAGVSPIFSYRGLFLRPSLDAGYGSGALSNVDRVIVVRGMLSLGYTIVEYGILSVTPYAGGGLIYHRVTGSVDDKTVTKTYYHPVIGCAAGFDFRINERFSVSLVPQYSVFFEKSSIDQSASLALGFKIMH